MKFKIDQKVETEILYNLIQKKLDRLIQPDILQRLKNKTKKDFKKELNKIHQEENKDLNNVLKIIKKNWERIEKDYCKLFQEITGYKPNPIGKTCYVTPSIYGFADMNNGNRIFITNKYSNVKKPIKDILNYLFPHEITHLFYRDILVKLNLPNAMKSSLVEGIDHLILFKSPIRDILKTSIKYNDLVKKNKKFMSKLEKLWNKRKDFKSFLLEGIKLDKKLKIHNI